MLDDFDMDFPEDEDDEEEGYEEEESSTSGNRTFMLVAGGLGGLIIIALICVAAYVFLIRPRTAENQASRQTQTALAISAANQALTQTQAAALPTATETQAPTDTQEPTDTLEPTEEAPPVEDGTGGGPTPDPRTATVQALLTQAALAQTQAAQQLLTQTATPTATGLPDTGFGDDAGTLAAPTLLGMAALLIVVIFIARRLRASNA
jgi:hypothetical protein